MHHRQTPRLPEDEEGGVGSVRNWAIKKGQHVSAVPFAVYVVIAPANLWTWQRCRTAGEHVVY